MICIVMHRMEFWMQHEINIKILEIKVRIHMRCQLWSLVLKADIFCTFTCCADDMLKMVEVYF